MYAGFQTHGARADLPLVSTAADESDLSPIVRRARPRVAVDRAAAGASSCSACSRVARSANRKGAVTRGSEGHAEQRVDGIADDVGRVLVQLLGLAPGQRRRGPGVDGGDGTG